MSVFDAPTTEQMTSSQTATETLETPTTESWVERVVSEKGDQWKDPEALAKGYYHAQQRIAELSSLEEELKKQDYAKNLLDQLKGNTQGQANEVVTPPPAASVTDPSDTVNKDNTSPKPEDITSLLEEVVTARERQTKVETTLKEKFGDQANSAVHTTAKELGLSIDEMKALSLKSPDAFLRLVGDPVTPQTNTLPKGTVNTSGFNSGNSGERNHSYYTKLRKTNRKAYDASMTQMIADRTRLGSNFYS